MNSIVIDTNLIFAALIPQSSKIRDILFDESMVFYAPNFLITEIYKHKDRLIKMSKLTESEFYLYFSGIIERVRFISTDVIGKESRQKAYVLCKDVDIKDISFVALAIDLNLKLWTGDQKLKKGLKEKGFNEFFET